MTLTLRRHLRALILGALSITLFLSGSMPARADVVLDKDGKVKVFGDVRGRGEYDWDSIDANGTMRADRGRIRVRARLGLVYTHSPAWSIGFRLRSGSQSSQQSPHMTIIDFNNNSQGESNFSFDQWWGRWKHDNYQLMVGRDSWSVWKQNELFLSDNVTGAGVTTSDSWKLGGEHDQLAAKAGYMAMPDGMVNFFGYLGYGQVVYSHDNDHFGLTGAAGYFVFDGAARTTRHPDLIPKNLRNGNGGRDYRITVCNVQVRIPAGNWPIAIGADWMRNGQDYDRMEITQDPFFTTNGGDYTLAGRKERSGYVGQISVGKAADKGDMQFSYTYAVIRALAVNASYAQDDWVRWGSSTQTDSSNLRGHELRYAYSISKVTNFVVRFWSVDSIVKKLPLGNGDGKRVRVDWNFKW